MKNYIKEIRRFVGSTPIFSPGSTILVFNEKKEVLLQLRKDTQNWGLPGGGMELGETFEEVAQRELFEETGLTAKKLRKLDVLSGQDYYFQYPNGDQVYNVIALFVAEKWEGNLQIRDDEGLDLQFFAFHEFPELEGRARLILEKLNEYIDLSTIVEIDIKDSKTAQRVLTMQKESYKVEAEYIGTYEIPPLKESLQELMDCGETFIGYYDGGEIAGAISYKLEDNEIDIHRVMVDPGHFRKGIARKLISHVEEHIPSQGMVVCTGAKNIPAVTLYLKLGFEKIRDIEVGHGLVLTQFRK